MQAGRIAVTSLVIGFLPVAVTILGSRNDGAVPAARSRLSCAAGIGWQAPDASTAPAGRRVAGLLCAVGALASWTVYVVGNARCLARLAAGLAARLAG